MADIDFEACGAFPLHRVRKYRAVRTPDGMRSVQVRTVNERPLRAYRLTWDDYSALRPVLQYIELLWSQTHGPVLPMNFTPPGEAALEVQFAADSLTTIRKSAALGEVTVDLVEVR